MSLPIHLFEVIELTRRFAGPEVEARMADFHKKNGQVLFGGRLLSDTDPRYAIPDNLGGHDHRSIGGVEVNA